MVILELRVEDRKGKKVSSINGDKPVQEKKRGMLHVVDS
jgi:hypothetical protein